MYLPIYTKSHTYICIYIYIYIYILENLNPSALLEKTPIVIRRLSLIQYLMIYLACIALVYVLWELLSVFTEYLEPSCFCFSPLPNLKL